MKLQRLIARSVFKYDDVSIDFDNETYLILANTDGNFEKSNGVGKSAIIELIVFGLFGETLRGVGDISKYHSGKFYIELIFDDNSKIIRSQKGIELVNKEGQSHLLKKTEGQQVINNKIKLDLDMLTFTNFFTPESNFFKLDDGQKKDVLMKLINIEFIDDVYDKVKDDLDNLNKNRLDNVIEIYGSEIKNIDEIAVKEEKARLALKEIQQYEQGLKEWLDFSKQLKLNLDNYKNKYNDNTLLRNKLKGLKEKIANTKYEEVEELRSKVADLKSKKNYNDIQVSELKGKISKVNTASHCPVFVDYECDKVNNKEYKQKLIDDYNKQITEFNTTNNEYINEISVLDKKITENIKIKNQLDSDKADFESGKTIYYKVKEELKVKSEENKNLVFKHRGLFKYRNIKIALQDIRIKQMEHADALAHLKVLTDKKQKLEEYKVKNEQVKKDISDMEVIKKFFGKDGLKQYAVSKIVKFLENEINIMLSDRFDNITVSIETSFDVGKRNSLKIKVNRMGNDVSWDEFSAGERRIFEIIFQLSMNKLYQSFSNYRFNVFAVDEAFDCLDKNNTTIVSNLIELLKGEDNTVFVISHNPEIQYLFDKKLIISSNGKDSFIKK